MFVYFSGGPLLVSRDEAPASVAKAPGHRLQGYVPYPTLSQWQRSSPAQAFCVSRPFRIRQFSPLSCWSLPSFFSFAVLFTLPCPRLPRPSRLSCRRRVGYLLGRAPGRQLPLPPHQMRAADRSDCRELLASLLSPRWLRPGQRLLFFFCHVPYIVFVPWSTYKDQL
jgi:hypothetical protein